MKIEEFRGECRCAEHRGQKRLSALNIKVEHDFESDILEFLVAAIRDAEQTGTMEKSARRAKVALRQLQAANN